MTRISIRTLAAGALALLLTFIGTATAQTTTSSAVLNSLEVQELIKRGDPADHARLGVHFAVLAEVHAADARRHSEMAVAFVATPTRRKAANAAADHCKRLERLNLQSAKTLRELAAHHDGLSGGKVHAPPRGAATFEAGKGAPAPTAEELTAWASKASAPAEHRAVEEYFKSLDKRYAAEADDHVAMAEAYRRTRTSQAAVHCDRLVSLLRDSAKEARTAVASHEDAAGTAR